jgi:membrane-associated HD superfamily phosphohydrolase
VTFLLKDEDMDKPITPESNVPWKAYLTITVESLLSFYLATFSLAMYLKHRGENWIVGGVFLIILYLFVIFACGKRVIDKVSLAALMLIIPIAPLIALIMVVTLIPILEKL